MALDILMRSWRPRTEGIAQARRIQLPFRRPTMNSPVVKRSIVIAGHKTSVSLEDAFWKALKEIAISRGTTLSNLVTSIDVDRRQGNLSSCLRLFVLDFYRYRLTEVIGKRTASSEVEGLRTVKSA
jgi:predicted DNA-binding ribbon-helix-helix protein